jgi:CheY-like chemotaxis protein
MIRAAATGPEVLVVDDDGDCRSLSAEFLREHGFPVIEAPNGRAALDYLLGARQLPALIVADLNMPIMTGWEMIAVLRGYLRFATLPIVVVTGEPVSPVLAEQFKVQRLAKPWMGEDLLALVRAHLGAPVPSTSDD